VRRIDLPGDQWADLRDPDEVTVGAKRRVLIIAAGLSGALGKIQAAAEAAGGAVDPQADIGLTVEESEEFLRMQDASIVARLAAWSYDEPLPTMDDVTEMPSGRYEALVAASTQFAIDVANLGLDMGTGGEPDPKDPTGASKPSGGRSKGASARKRTPKSSTGGSRTSTAS